MRKSSVILAIDTSTDVTVVGLFDGVHGRPLAVAADAAEARHGDILLDRIGAVLAQAGLDPVDVSVLAVGVGPGSFTGLRIGLATAQGWALALDIPTFGVPSMQAIAWPLLQDCQDRAGPVVVIGDAFKGEVTLAVYQPVRDGWIQPVPPNACSPEAAARDLVERLSFGPAPRLQGGGLRRYASLFAAELPQDWSVGPEAADVPGVAALVELALQRQRAGDRGDPQQLVPCYVRGADAKLPERPLKL